MDELTEEFRYQSVAKSQYTYIESVHLDILRACGRKPSTSRRVSRPTVRAGERANTVYSEEAHSFCLTTRHFQQICRSLKNEGIVTSSHIRLTTNSRKQGSLGHKLEHFDLVVLRLVFN